MKTTWLLEILGVAVIAPLSAAAAVRARISPEDIQVQRNRPRSSDAITATPHYVTLKQSPNPVPLASHPSRRRTLSGRDTTPGFPFNTGLTNVHDIYYLANITIGGETTLAVNVDTGSSDTWFIKSPFQCIDYFLRPTDESACGFGPGFKGNLSDGQTIDEPFSRSYGDGTFVSGYFGFDDVTIGGVTIKHQQVAIVNNTYWYGDGNTSGMLGLAYPLMTGLGGIVDAYDPIFTSMWKTGEILPLFTIALSRDDEGRNVTKEMSSYLAFGGIPPVDYDDATWVRTPIEPMAVVPSWGIEGDARGLYIIQADAYVYGRENKSITDPESTEGMTFNTTQFPILVDSGSTLTILPTDLAMAIFKSFRPPAQFLENEGAWFAPCNVQMARFGVKIGTQQIYWMSPDDLLRQGARDTATGNLCRVGIMESDTGPHILGVSWLANVVAVFDVGNDEMRFAKRLAY